MLNNRQRMKAILTYGDSYQMPVVHFGFWSETLEKWADEGHISRDLAVSWSDGNEADEQIGRKLGFDLNYYNCLGLYTDIYATFDYKVLEELADGSRTVLNPHGVVVLEKDVPGPYRQRCSTCSKTAGVGRSISNPDCNLRLNGQCRRKT